MESDDTATCLPALSQKLHEKFGGPHTQFAAKCYVMEADGTMVSVVAVVSCTQLFICDTNAFVIRSMLLSRLMAVYHHTINTEEMEVMLVFDREHDLLLRGAMLCDGQPPKAFISTVRALYSAHHPNVPLVLHMDCPSPLRDLAKLTPPAGYAAPLPQPEDAFDNCPCWRQADVLNITDDEFGRRVRNMFIVYAPEKLPSVNDLCRKYAKKKGGALQFLVGKYGPEPTDEHAKAVLASHEREKKFNDLIAPDASAAESSVAAQEPSQTKPLTSVMQLQKQKKVTEDNEVYYSTLLLTKQPSGGHGRIQLRVTPIPYMMEQQPFSHFARREVDPQHEFWYLSNEGCAMPFDTAPDATAPFGYNHGDRVLSTWGVTRGKWSTIVGVRDGCLWVHDDGDTGAAALAGFRSQDELERLNGWIRGDNITVNPLTTMLVATIEGVRSLAVNPEEVFARFGFHHGDKVECLSPCSSPHGGYAIVVGVNPENSRLYVIFVDRDSSPRRRLNSAQPLPQCFNHQDIIQTFGWKVTGAERVFQNSKAISASSSTPLGAVQ